MAPKTASSTKRSRATAEQIRIMVDLLEEVPGLASGKFQKMHGKLEQQKLWNKLAGKLNAVGGATKSPEQWLPVWRDLKNRTSNRVKDINNQRAQTGNRPVSVAPLTDTEKRIKELIGERYCEGAGICKDSVPMDEVLWDTAHNKAHNEEMHLVMEEDEGEVEYLEEFDASSEVQSQGEGEEQPTTSSAAIAVMQRCAGTTPTTPENRPTTPAIRPITPAIRPRTPTPTQRTPAQTPRRSSRRKSNDEEAERQNRSLAIAEKQADTMRMLAENQIKLGEKQANTMRMLAENQTKLADNQEKQTEATFAMAKAIERMGKGLEVCAEAFKELSGAILTKDLPNN